MKKILIAVDYDPAAQKVAETGYSLGRAMDADIILLHVIEDPVYYSSLQYSPIMGFGGFSTPDMVPVTDAGELRNAAILFLQKTKMHLGDENLQTIAEEGETAACVLKVAKERGIDIIVMGRHDRSGLEKILTGSVSDEVLHHSSIPVLIIPTKE